MKSAGGHDLGELNIHLGCPRSLAAFEDRGWRMAWVSFLMLGTISLPLSRPVFADLPGHDPGLTSPSRVSSYDWPEAAGSGSERKTPSENAQKSGAFKGFPNLAIKLSYIERSLTSLAIA